MGSGGYVICEWSAVQKDFPKFQQVFADVESQIIAKCTSEWAPRTFGYMSPSGSQFGRTTILPRLFNDHSGLSKATWRETFLGVGAIAPMMTGGGTGSVMLENFKVGWIGIALPNKNQYLTEIKFQIGDRKFMRINLEELRGYEEPALIFEEGFIIDEEQSFTMDGYLEGLLPQSTNNRVYQRLVMLGAAYYSIIDKVLGNCGAVIPNV